MVYEIYLHNSAMKHCNGLNCEKIFREIYLTKEIVFSPKGRDEF